MKSFYDYFPYIMLAVFAMVVLFQVAGPQAGAWWIRGEDLIGQLHHWTAGGSTAVTVNESPQQDDEPEPDPNTASPDLTSPEYLVVAAYGLQEGWWNRDSQLRDRDAGEFLAQVLDAQGSNNVKAWGVSGLGLERPGFAIVLQHDDLLVLHDVLVQLSRLPATEWFEPLAVFYGQASSLNAELVPDSTTELSTESPVSALVFEQRNQDWFLLTHEKRMQLMTPRIESFRGLYDVGNSVEVYNSLGVGDFTTVTVFDQFDLQALPEIRAALRSHWEQKYVKKTWVYVGPRLSISKVLEGIR